MGDLGTDVFPLLGKHAQWIVVGFRSSGQRALPPEAVYTLVERNVTLRGFNLEGWLALVPEALSALFAAVAEGKLRIQTTLHPLSDAANVHRLVESLKTTGKIVFVP